GGGAAAAGDPLETAARTRLAALLALGAGAAGGAGAARVAAAARAAAVGAAGAAGVRGVAAAGDEKQCDAGDRESHGAEVTEAARRASHLSASRSDGAWGRSPG